MSLTSAAYVSLEAFILFALLGLIVGSFLNVLIHRLPDPAFSLSPLPSRLAWVRTHPFDFLCLFKRSVSALQTKHFTALPHR